MQQPHASTSKILMGNYTPGKASFKLHLLDSKKNPVQLNEKPEILFEGGLGSIEEIKMNEDFSWEFTLIHPENNPMLEFSVRAQGAYLKGLYRYTSAD
jgi:hypothetical protein